VNELANQYQALSKTIPVTPTAQGEDRQMKVDTYKCDQCGIQKGVTNHWWRGYAFGDCKGIVVIEWDGIPPTENVKDFEAHLCGLSCLSEWVSKQLS